MPALEGTKLVSVNLTDLAQVKASIDTSYDDTTQDAHIGTVITAVSDRITQYLGFHTLSATRTETYEGRRFERVVTLDGKPVTTFTSLKYHSESDFTGVLAEATTSYTVHKRSGWIRLDFAPIYKNNYFQVEYTGGLGVDATAVISGYPEISLAATMQCKYYLQRRDSMGGNITTGAGSTSFESEYTLQKEVRMILDQYARR
jgi:hypothetical protein